MAAVIYLNRDESRRVDQIAIERYGMSGLVLMENAGRGCADTLCQLGIAGPVVICCGKGNNAGDGFVIARHLDIRRYAVRVLLWCEPDQLRGDAATNFSILAQTDVEIVPASGSSEPAWLADRLEGADWIIDALLGTGARGEPRRPLPAVIDMLNTAPSRRLAVDLPSGLDCDTGQPAGHTFRADHTCTFVAQKSGFRAPEAQPFLGQVHVLDIGAPRRLVDQL